MVQVHVRPVFSSGLRAAERVFERQAGVAQHPADQVRRGGSRAAVVQAQVQHDVPDWAVLPGDLLVGVNNTPHGIELQLFRSQRIIINPIP